MLNFGRVNLASFFFGWWLKGRKSWMRKLGSSWYRVGHLVLWSRRPKGESFHLSLGVQAQRKNGFWGWSMDPGFPNPTIGQNLVGLDFLQIYLPFMEGYVLNFMRSRGSWFFLPSFGSFGGPSNPWECDARFAPPKHGKKVCIVESFKSKTLLHH